MIVSGSMDWFPVFSLLSADISRNVGSAGWLINRVAADWLYDISAAVSSGTLSGCFRRLVQYVYIKGRF